MNSRQRRKARRRSWQMVHAWADNMRATVEAVGGSIDFTLPWPQGLNWPDGADWPKSIAMFCLALCMACGTGTEDDAGEAQAEQDAGQTQTDAGYDAGEEPVDAGPLDACEERQAQWCRQGCIGTIGIDRDCPELDCEC